MAWRCGRRDWKELTVTLCLFGLFLHLLTGLFSAKAVIWALCIPGLILWWILMRMLAVYVIDRWLW